MTSNSHFVCPPIIPPTDAADRSLEAALRAALAFIDTALVADENPTMSKRAIVRIISESLAATPAVGGEREALQRIIDTTNGVDSSAVCWLRLEKVRNLATAALAAQPASPLRGREPTVDEVRQTIADEWGSHLCYRDSFGTRSCRKDTSGLGCRCDDIARAIMSTHTLTPPHPGRVASYDRIANALIDDGYSTFAVKDWIYLLNESGLVICESASPPEQPAAYPSAEADEEHADLLRRLATVPEEEK